MVASPSIADEARQMEAGEVTREPFVPEESPIPPTVYRTNAGEPGRLTAEEVEALVGFHAARHRLDGRLRRKRRGRDVSPLEATYLLAKLEELLDLNENALEALEAEMDAGVAVDREVTFEEFALLSLDEVREGLSPDEDDGQ